MASRRGLFFGAVSVGEARTKFVRDVLAFLQSLVIGLTMELAIATCPPISTGLQRFWKK